jgi:galactokinase
MILEETAVTVSELKEKLRGNIGRQTIARLYGEAPDVIPWQVQRYDHLLEVFARNFPFATHSNVALFSAPGRIEVGGNHTDHNNGRVLAAAINLDTIAVASPVPGDVVAVRSEGYAEPFVVDTKDLTPRTDEHGSSCALIRGVAARLRERGFRLGGFQACVTSEVGVGSGLSSSAAFEVLIGTTFNHFYNAGKIEPREIALAGRHAENKFFGKPSGLMDQMTSAVGGFVTIDFADPTDPVVRQVKFDLAAGGMSLVVTNTGGSHADLTPEYASVPREMQAVAKALGAETLRGVSAGQVIEQVSELRARLGDRAILRALHYFGDNDRVVAQVEALESGDLVRFLALVNESGRSSWMLLQNCYVGGATEQGITLGLALSENVLHGRGAWRVHGGGFAGTILAVVPNDSLAIYTDRMEAAFGKGAAQVLHVRQTGATRIAFD